MINGHALSADMKSALFVLDSMKGGGADVAPNALTYATLCKGFALQGRDSIHILDFGIIFVPFFERLA